MNHALHRHSAHENQASYETHPHYNVWFESEIDARDLAVNETMHQAVMVARFTDPIILALLDCLGKTHEIEIHPSSVCRLSVPFIISEPVDRFCLKFWLYDAMGKGHFVLILESETHFPIFTFFSVFVKILPDDSKNVKTYKLQPIFFSNLF